ncbi:tetratricopeptide repeat protein [bacterium]|nr:tetratricopeptide repeat protein [bacterium]
MKSRSKQRTKKQHRRLAATNGDATPLLSLCMIVKNESQNLAGCLQSVQDAVDEIIVVDTGSTDDTRTIAKNAGARVFDFTWCDDFSAARNESIRHARGRYILWLDADDRVNPAEIQKLKQLKTSLPQRQDHAYYLVVHSEAARMSGDLTFYQLRLFPNIPTARFEWQIHEQISNNLKKSGIICEQRPITIRHIGNEQQTDLIRKSKRNLAIIERVLEKKPEDFVMRFQLGRTLANLERYEEAITAMQQVVDNPVVKQQHPQFFLETSLLMGRYCSDIGLDDSAQQVYQSLLPDYPDNGLIHYYLGTAYFEAEKYAAAITELKQCQDTTFSAGFMPLNLDVINFQRGFLLGQAYQKTGKIEQARLSFEAALASPTYRYRILQELGLLQLNQNAYPLAADYFQQAIDEKDGRTDANYSNLGLALRKANRFEDAEQAFRTALDINPDRVEALTNLGHLSLLKKDYLQAISCFNRAKLMDPDMLDTKLGLCEIYFQQNNLDKLVKECETLLRELGLESDLVLQGLEDLAALFLNIGNALHQTQRQSLAMMAYQLAFMIFPSTQALKKMLPLATGSQSLDACKTVIQESLAQHNPDPAFLTAVKDQLATLAVG